MAHDSEDLKALREHLTGCAELYLTDELDSQRRAVAETLFRIAEYLLRQDFPPETVLPLLRPWIALSDREGNALDPMFSERPRGGRPKSTTGAHIRTAILAVFADAWLRLRHDDPRNQSLKLGEAARKMRGGWFGNLTGAKLATAREIVSREDAGHAAVQFYNEFASIYDKVAAQSGAERAFEQMVRHVDQHEVGPLIKS